MDYRRLYANSMKVYHNSENSKNPFLNNMKFSVFLLLYFLCSEHAHYRENHKNNNLSMQEKSEGVFNVIMAAWFTFFTYKTPF
jgi:hypothetical protein